MVHTAYNREGSYSYDEKRFSTAQGRAFDQLEKEQLRRALRRLRSPSRCLEVGCGSGRFLRAILARDQHTAYGIDPSPHMLAVVMEKSPEEGQLRLARSEGASLPFADSSFDLVYSIRVLNQLASRSYAMDMIEEIVRVSGGLVLLEFVNRSRLVRKSDQGVQLALVDIKKTLTAFPAARISSVSGILFFSQTVLSLVPSPCLSAFLRIDRKLSEWFPNLCGRIYVLLEKESPAADRYRSAT